MASRWQQVSLRTNVEWPTQSYTVKFDSYDLELRPAVKNCAPDVVLNFDDTILSDISAHKLIREFLSVLVWLKQQSAYEFGSANSSIWVPQHGPEPQFQNVDDHFKLELFPNRTHPKAKLGLALYREAINVNSAPYKFLGFWKLVSLIFPDGHDSQFEWLLKTLPKISDSESVNRLQELNGTSTYEQIVRNHLYGARRCAIAHATTNTINPDDPDDLLELNLDICIAHSLAKFVIEEELGVKSELSLYRENGLEPPERTNQVRISPGLLMGPG